MSNFCIEAVRPPPELSYFSSVASILLCIFIALGNGLIFVAVYKDPFKRLRNPFSYFLVNLAISDFILGVVTMPLSSQYHLSEVIVNSKFPSPLAIHLSFFITSTASVLSMGALCFDRYMAVAIRLHHRKKLSRVRCLSISIGIWIISSVSTMIYFLVGYETMFLVVIHSIFLVTLGMMILTYLKVYRVLTSLAKELGSQKGTAKWTSKSIKKKRAASKEKSVTQTFLVLLLLFVLCYFPVIVLAYVLELCSTCSCDARHILRDVELILVCINSVINPFACIIRLKIYKKSIWVIMKCAVKESYDMDCSQMSGSSTPAQPRIAATWANKRSSKVHNTKSTFPMNKTELRVKAIGSETSPNCFVNSADIKSTSI